MPTLQADGRTVGPVGTSLIEGAMSERAICGEFFNENEDGNNNDKDRMSISFQWSMVKETY